MVHIPTNYIINLELNFRNGIFADARSTLFTPILCRAIS